MKTKHWLLFLIWLALIVNLDCNGDDKKATMKPPPVNTTCDYFCRFYQICEPRFSPEWCQCTTQYQRDNYTEQELYQHTVNGTIYNVHALARDHCLAQGVKEPF